MQNKLQGFTYKQGTIDIERKLRNAAKVARDLTKEELHKYLLVKFNGSSSAFDAYVGTYHEPDVDIAGISITKAQALMMMQEMLKKAKVVDMPFTNMVYSNAEVAVTPMSYIVTDKVGNVQQIGMVRGLPATEPKATIIAHQNITLAMATSSPESDKISNQGITKKEMTRSVPTDPEGTYFPPFSAMTLVDALEAGYEGSSNIIDVRSRLLASAKGAGNMMDVGTIALTAMGSMVDYLKKQQRWKPKWDMFDCVRPIENPAQRAVYENAGVDPVQIVIKSQFPTFKVTDIDQMWTFLDSHREVRGSDTGKISPLTNAVYYGELDYYYRQVASTADVMYIHEVHKTNTIFHTTNVYFNKLWSMLQINVPVLSSNINNPYWDDQPYGLYQPPKKTHNLRTLSIECVTLSPPTRNSKTKVWEYTPTREVCKERIQQFFETHTNAAVKIYPYPELWEDFKGMVHPSLHAHSGVVWVSNVQISPYTQEDHIARVVRANVCKTYYPCYLQRFPAKDIIVWPQVFVKRTAKRKVNLGFEVMFTDTEVQLESIDLVALDIAQKKIKVQERNQMESSKPVQNYKAMKDKMVAEMAKKLEAPVPIARGPTKDSHFEALDIDDDNQFGEGASGEDQYEEEYVPDNDNDAEEEEEEEHEDTEDGNVNSSVEEE